MYVCVYIYILIVSNFFTKKLTLELVLKWNIIFLDRCYGVANTFPIRKRISSKIFGSRL